MLIMEFLLAIDNIISAIDVHSTDIDLMQGGYVQAMLSYLLQANHFFPVDAYLTIATLYFGIYAFLLVKFVANILVNLIPDAWGVRFS